MGRQTKGRVYKAESGVFHVEYYHAGKRVRKSLGTRKRREADAMAKTLLAPFSAKSEVDRRAAAVATLQTASELQAEAVKQSNTTRLDTLSLPTYQIKNGRRRDLEPSTIRANKSLLAGFVHFMDDTFPDILLAKDATSRHAEAYAEHLDGLGLSGHTQNLRIAVAGKAFVAAGLDSPFGNIPRREIRAETRKPLTDKEALELCRDASGEMKCLYALLIYTGLRVGDCATMRWSSIANDRITRRLSKTRATVSFPLHPALSAVLDEVPSKERREFVTPKLAAMYEKRQSDVSRLIVEDMKRHGLETNEMAEGRTRAVPKLGAHSFRHLFGRQMAMARVPLSAVQQWLGHSSPTITRIYSEISTTTVEREILAALPACLDTSDTNREESDRRRLAAVVESAPIEIVRAMLAVADSHMEKPNSPGSVD